MDKFTLKDFLTHFGKTAQCLEFLKKLRWPNGICCKKCERITRAVTCAQPFSVNR